MTEVVRPRGRLGRSGWLALSVWVGLLVLGCSSREHPPFIGLEPNKRAPTAAGGEPGITDNGDSAGNGDSTSDGDSTSGGSGTDSVDIPASGPFDPSLVYLVAPLQSPTKLFAIGPLSEPQAYIYGFSSYVQFRGSELDYLSAGTTGTKLRVFTPDLTSAPPPASFEFPETSGNDTVLPTPACTKGAESFLTGPDGSYAYRCYSSQPWYVGSRTIFPSAIGLVALGAGNLALLRMGDNSYSVRNFGNSTTARVPDLEDFDNRAAHWSENGFHLVVEGPDGHLLVEVHADGSTERLGEFVFPSDLLAGSRGTLTADDHLYVAATGFANQDRYTVLRCTLNDDCVAVYSVNYDDSYFDLTGATLITGR